MEKFGSGIRDKHPGSATLAQRRIFLIISLAANVVVPECFIPDQNPTFQVISDPILTQGQVLKDQFDEYRNVPYINSCCKIFQTS
jgi:hypothetical protein